MIRIKVDGETLWHGEAGDWEETAPDSFRDLIKPGYKPQTYMKAIAVVLSEALVTNASIRINVLTAPNGFQMKVVNE